MAESHVWSRAAGALIVDARLQSGLSQEELAVRAGVSWGVIEAFESGSRQPTMPELYRMLAIAGFDLRVRLAPVDSQDALAAWEASQTTDGSKTWGSEVSDSRRWQR